MNYQLINFNIPTKLKTQLDLIAKHKHISRTSIINTQLESYCRSELAYIEASNQPAGSLLWSFQPKRQRLSISYHKQS